MSQHIVVVDDDPTLRNRLRKYLQSEGYEVSDADCGAALRRVVEQSDVDLVILDLVMPGEDGLSLTRYLRERTDVGILILTGKGAPVDRVVGLEMGADDYLAKPFDLRELLARIRSILRRATPGNRGRAEASDVSADRVCFDRWTFDRGVMELQPEGGETVHLTAAESRLLAAFVDNAGRALSRDQLLDAIADRSWSPFDRSIDLHVSHLRRKLEEDPGNPRLIKTVRGTGYVFTAAVRPG